VRDAYSSCVKVARSFKSAPAQKLVSMSLAMINALVDPVSPSLCMLVIWWFSSASNCLEMALRAAGRFRERIRMLPQCGAGTRVTFIEGDRAVEYAHRCRVRLRVAQGLIRVRKGILTCMEREYQLVAITQTVLHGCKARYERRWIRHGMGRD
jgi:hypothetical protein